MAPPFAWDVAVMRITVAALMTTPWIARFLDAPSSPDTDLVLLPGLCEGDPALVAQKLGVPVEKGPKDLRQIPEYFGRAAAARDYGAYDIEIVAEVNNAPRLAREAIRLEARSEEHTSELQSRFDLVCRLLLEKKKKKPKHKQDTH